MRQNGYHKEKRISKARRQEHIERHKITIKFERVKRAYTKRV